MNQSVPIGSMYGIFTYVWLSFIVNVGKYTLRPMDPSWAMSHASCQPKGCRFISQHRTVQHRTTQGLQIHVGLTGFLDLFIINFNRVWNHYKPSILGVNTLFGSTPMFLRSGGGVQNHLLRFHIFSREKDRRSNGFFPGSRTEKSESSW